MLSPLGAAILGYLMLGEPWRLPEFFATVVSLAGAVLVAKPPFIFGSNPSQGPAFYTGVTYALTASVSAAFAYIFVRMLGTTAKMPWSNVCFSQAIAQMLLSVPSMYIFGQHLSLDVTAFQLGMIVLGGLIGAVSQILMTIGMQQEKSAAATAMRMSDVAFGYLWQVLFTADALSLLSLGGAIMITSSILIIVIWKPPPAPAPAIVPADSAADSSKSKGKGVVEMRELTAAVHSIADKLRTSYDLEPGFQDDETGLEFASDGDGEGTSNALQTNQKFNYSELARLHAGEEDDEDDVEGGERDSSAAAAAHTTAGSGAKAVLSRMIKSPLYGRSSNGNGASSSSQQHQYSTLAQGEVDGGMGLRYTESTDL